MTKAKAYGGVLVNDEGKILLRKPTNNFDNYAWTFAKGRLDAGETPEQAALREVQEETGVEAEIIGKVPGSFEGGVTVTEYFLMRPLNAGEFSWETEEIRWVTPDEARQLIAETTNDKGRKRDLATLEEAVKAYQVLPES